MLWALDLCAVKDDKHGKARQVWLYSCCDSSFAVPSASAKHRRQSLEGSPPPGVLAEGEAGGEPGGLRRGCFARARIFWGGMGLLM